MNRKTFRRATAAVVAILLWSIAGVARVTNSEEQEEITRLAQLTQWKPGTVVADIGAGDASYSFAAAEKVGPSGRVYATEIDTDKLKTLKAEVAKRKLQNVMVVEGAADDTKLPSNCCDTIFLRHVYHHIMQPREFDKNLVRSLKPGAYLAIIDFPLAYGQVIPATDPATIARINHGRDAQALSDVSAGQIWLQMAHRCLAAIIGLTIGAFWLLVRHEKTGTSFLRKLANLWLGLVILQIALGAWTIWSNKAADIATAHVAVGAATFATAVAISSTLLRFHYATAVSSPAIRRPNLAEAAAR